MRELADLTGLSSQVTGALADTYRGPWTHAPGEVFADLAAAVADGADCVDGVGSRRRVTRPMCFGSVAFGNHLVAAARRADSTRCIRRGSARRAPVPASRPGPPEPLPTMMARCIWMSVPPAAIDRSDNKAGRPPRSLEAHLRRCHPLPVFLDRREIAAGEAPAGLLRPGDAGSGAPRPPITSPLLGAALEVGSPAVRPSGPLKPSDAPEILDPLRLLAGATYAFAAACRNPVSGSPSAPRSTPASATPREVLNTAAA